MYGSTLLLAVALSLQAPQAASAQSISWEVDHDSTLVGVVTHRAGFAARLAHNHLVAAQDYLVRLELDPQSLGRTVFDIEALANELVVDDPGLRERFESRLATLDIVDELGAPEEGDRADIRETMLSDDQLDAEQFPRISVTLVGVREDPHMRGEVEFPFRAEIALRVHGETATTDASARYEQDGDVLLVEAVGDFTFEQFGIEPYSAFLGSVKNENEFQVYLSLRATR